VTRAAFSLRLRFVDVSDNALDWPEEYQKRGGKTEGQIVPCTADELRDHPRENWARVVCVTKEGKPKRRWIQQGMRHSFCSYWLALHGAIDRLVIQFRARIKGSDVAELLPRHYQGDTSTQSG
jgi:hypothetical protein